MESGAPGISNRVRRPRPTFLGWGKVVRDVSARVLNGRFTCLRFLLVLIYHAFCVEKTIIIENANIVRVSA